MVALLRDLDVLRPVLCKGILIWLGMRRCIRTKRIDLIIFLKGVSGEDRVHTDTDTTAQKHKRYV